MLDLDPFLATHTIPYQRFDHPPVYTCEEAARLGLNLPGSPTKNLLLRDQKGQRYFLVVVGHETSVDLKRLGAELGVKLSFANPPDLKRLLGVEPGAVTLLGLIHDEAHVVELLIDARLQGSALQCHPLVNTATMVIPATGIQRFLEVTGHVPRYLAVPEREV